MLRFFLDHENSRNKHEINDQAQSTINTMQNNKIKIKFKDKK
jgi:hypothetical protein